MTESKQRRATQKDHDLVKRTEAELRAETAISSFDIDTLKKRISQDDPAQAFIQAHLYIDHVISLILTENVPFPRFLQLDRTGFAQKTQLASALGLLSPMEIAAAKVVNSIRNKIAHRLDYVVSPEDDVKIRSTIGQHALRKPDGSDIPLPEVLGALAVMIDMARQERAFERSMRLKQVARLRIAIDNVSVAL